MSAWLKVQLENVRRTVSATPTVASKVRDDLSLEVDSTRFTLVQVYAREVKTLKCVTLDSTVYSRSSSFLNYCACP